MTSPSIVRAATPEDHQEILRLFGLLYDEQFMFRLSPKKIDYYISRFLDPKSIKADDGGPRGFIGTIGPVGKLEAMIIMGISQYWYTDEFSIDEYANFVDPEHRSSRHAKALISYAKHIIDSQLSSYPSLRLIIGILSVKRTAAKVRLYSQEMQPCGAYFTWPEIPEVTSEPMRRLYKGH